MQPFAVFAVSAILVSLCAVFLFLGYGVFAGDRPNNLNLPQPVVMTAAAVVLIGLFLSSLFIGNEIIFTDNTADSAIARTEAGSTIQDEELAALVARIDRAADSIYSGLDTTKEFIGKTEVRKQAIEHGRDHANERLISLAERLRAALRGEESLREFDQRIAEHIANGMR